MTEREADRVRPLTEGYVVKGGRNHGPSQIAERPAPPAPILRQQLEASGLIEAAKLFTRAAHDARDALMAAGRPCPSSIAFAAEKARNALRALGVEP